MIERVTKRSKTSLTSFHNTNIVNNTNTVGCVEDTMDTLMDTSMGTVPQSTVPQSTVPQSTVPHILKVPQFPKVPQIQIQIPSNRLDFTPTPRIQSHLSKQEKYEIELIQQFLDHDETFLIDDDLDWNKQLEISLEVKAGAEASHQEEKGSFLEYFGPDPDPDPDPHQSLETHNLTNPHIKNTLEPPNHAGILFTTQQQLQTARAQISSLTVALRDKKGEIVIARSRIDEMIRINNGLIAKIPKSGTKTALVQSAALDTREIDKLKSEIMFKDREIKTLKSKYLNDFNTRKGQHMDNSVLDSFPKLSQIKVVNKEKGKIGPRFKSVISSFNKSLVPGSVSTMALVNDFESELGLGNISNNGNNGNINAIQMDIDAEWNKNISTPSHSSTSHRSEKHVLLVPSTRRRFQKYEQISVLPPALQSLNESLQILWNSGPSACFEAIFAFIQKQGLFALGLGEATDEGYKDNQAKPLKQSVDEIRDTNDTIGAPVAPVTRDTPFTLNTLNHLWSPLVLHYLITTLIQIQSLPLAPLQRASHLCVFMGPRPRLYLVLEDLCSAAITAYNQDDGTGCLVHELVNSLCVFFNSIMMRVHAWADEDGLGLGLADGKTDMLDLGFLASKSVEILKLSIRNKTVMDSLITTLLLLLKDDSMVLRFTKLNDTNNDVGHLVSLLFSMALTLKTDPQLHMRLYTLMNVASKKRAGPSVPLLLVRIDALIHLVNPNRDNPMSKHPLVPRLLRDILWFLRTTVEEGTAVPIDTVRVCGLLEGLVSISAFFNHGRGRNECVKIAREILGLFVP